jgi:hypothetical protein
MRWDTKIVHSIDTMAYNVNFHSIRSIFIPSFILLKWIIYLFISCYIHIDVQYLYLFFHSTLALSTDTCAYLCNMLDMYMFGYVSISFYYSLICLNFSVLWEDNQVPCRKFCGYFKTEIRNLTYISVSVLRKNFYCSFWLTLI